jgi:hypothetical protein
MRKDVQRMPKSQDQSKIKHTQHNMIEQKKKVVCVFGRENKKLASGGGTYFSRRHVVR